MNLRTLSVAVLLICWSISASHLVQATSYDSLVSEGRSHLAGNPQMAFEKGLEALALSPTGWEAALLCGEAEAALGIDDLADEFFQQALKSAPSEKRPEIERIIERSKSRKDTSILLQEAEDALAQGLKAKAANIMELAFRSSGRPEVGLRALQLRVGLSKVTVGGATHKRIDPRGLSLAEELITSFHGTTEGTEAQRLYDDHFYSVDAIYGLGDIILLAAKQRCLNDSASCLSTLTTSQTLGVGGRNVYNTDTRILMRMIKVLVLLDVNSIESALKELKVVTKIAGTIDIAQWVAPGSLLFVARSRLPDLFEDSAVSSYIVDVLGEDALLELKLGLRSLSARDFKADEFLEFVRAWPSIHSLSVYDIAASLFRSSLATDSVPVFLRAKDLVDIPIFTGAFVTGPYLVTTGSFAPKVFLASVSSRYPKDTWPKLIDTGFTKVQSLSDGGAIGNVGSLYVRYAELLFDRVPVEDLRNHYVEKDALPIWYFQEWIPDKFRNILVMAGYSPTLSDCLESFGCRKEMGRYVESVNFTTVYSEDSISSAGSRLSFNWQCRIVDSIVSAGFDALTQPMGFDSQPTWLHLLASSADSGSKHRGFFEDGNGLSVRRPDSIIIGTLKALCRYKKFYDAMRKEVKGAKSPMAILKSSLAEPGYKNFEIWMKENKPTM